MGLGRIGMGWLAAFVAGLALVLQAAFAAAAPPLQRDIFGNVICADATGGPSQPAGRHDGGHTPDCCLLACAASFQSVADSPAATIAWPAAVASEPAVPDAIRHAAPQRERRTPANPRAPPAAA